MARTPPIRGRGSDSNPKNRFERRSLEPEPGEVPDRETLFLRDRTRSILTKNDSPDVGFDVSLNPYRGCEHGCPYCYARPTHEYLGFSAGLHFETRILVKEQAPELLFRELSSPGWTPRTVALSGVTDPYQPVERRLRLTRRCLEVFSAFKNPVALITKNALVTRDVDLLSELAGVDAVAVNLSVTTMDARLSGRLEPRASRPKLRLEAISALRGAGIPVGVMVAPILPGLTDHEVFSILEAAAEAGAQWAGYTVLRLPHGVKDVFAAWLDRWAPDRKRKVLGRVREMRGGSLNDPRFRKRMRGEGLYADHLAAVFATARRRAGLDGPRRDLSTASFRVPGTLF